MAEKVSSITKSPAVSDVHILWITAGLSCDGDSVSVTAAEQPSMRNSPGGPMQTLSSASRTCMASASAVECTATVGMPSSLHARKTRSAIDVAPVGNEDFVKHRFASETRIANSE